MDFDIRYSQLEDEKFLKNWLLAPNELENFPMSTQKEVEEATKNWIGFSRFRASLTAEKEGEVLAIGTLFLMPYKKIAHHCLFNLIVAPEHRRKKIGSSMVKNLKNLAKKYFRLEILLAEVYEESILNHLLPKEGFSLFFTQKNFVKEKEKRQARLLWECEL